VKASTTQRVDLQASGHCSVDLGSASITVTDSTTNNAVQVSGFDPDAIRREVKYWCRSERYCHNAATRGAARDNLQDIIEACEESVLYLKAEAAKKAEAAS